MTAVVAVALVIQGVAFVIAGYATAGSAWIIFGGVGSPPTRGDRVTGVAMGVSAVAIGLYGGACLVAAVFVVIA